MLKKLRDLFGSGKKPPEPLRGRPKVRREKVYSAESGYVYQYFYEGFRDAARASGAGEEYVFDCTSDRASRFTVTVFAEGETLARWQSENERELNEVERYAVVKMTLFELFDEHEHITKDLDVELAQEAISRHAETLELFE